MTATTDQPLQFETAISHESQQVAASGMAGVTCASCQGVIAEEYFDLNGKSVCAPCRARLEEFAETPRGLGVLGRAGGFGAVAAIAGAILYYAVVAITEFEIGLVAIAIGYMVGYGVRRGARGRGGRRFQVLAIVLTYWAVGLAYTPFAIKGILEGPARDAAQSGTQTPGAQTPAPQPAAEPSGRGVALVLAIFVGIIVVMSFALPVFAVVSSLPGGVISAAIIGFGMQQAWRMTGAPALEISGPYKIAAAAPPVV